jgi:hypothetical protein
LVPIVRNAVGRSVCRAGCSARFFLESLGRPTAIAGLCKPLNCVTSGHMSSVCASVVSPDVPLGSHRHSQFICQKPWPLSSSQLDAKVR